MDLKIHILLSTYWHTTTSSYAQTLSLPRQVRGGWPTDWGGGSGEEEGGLAETRVKFPSQPLLTTASAPFLLAVPKLLSCLSLPRELGAVGGGEGGNPGCWGGAGKYEGRSGVVSQYVLAKEAQ